MSKNTNLASLINYLSVDGSGNIVLTGSLIGPGGATYATQSYVGTQVATKLPLSGGTLTGSLSGTSATFTDTLSVIAPSSSTAIALRGRSGDNYSALRFQSNNGSTTYATIYSNGSDLHIENGGSAALTIAANRAATFSSSVTATNLYLGSLTNEQLMISGTGSRGIGVSTITSGDPFVRLYDNTTIKGDIWWGRSGNYMGINSLGNVTTAINPFGGNVGIGTSSPTGLLHLYTSETAFRIQSSTGGNLQFGQWDTVHNRIESSGGRPMLITSYGQPIKLGIDGSEHMRIHSDGKVGIGTSSPKTLLQSAINGGYPILGSNNTSSNLLLSSANTLWGMYFGLDGNSGTGWIQQMRNDAATSYNLLLNPVGGNIGIGTISPTDKLDVAGEVVFGPQTEKVSIGSASLAWNRKVATGLIYDSSRFAYQFQHTGSTSSGSDYLALQVYSPGGGQVNATALVVNGVANVGIGTASPSHRLQVSGNIYSTDTVFGRNLKPEGWASVSAGSPSAGGIPLGYSSINITSPCDNNWRTILSNINDVKGYFWVTLGDAASKDTANYMMAMTSPGYGVSNFGVVSYQDNGWNTGGFEFTTSSANGTYSLLVRCTSYYSGGNTAYGTIYFLRLE
jgi:hypothetical protein